MGARELSGSSRALDTDRDLTLVYSSQSGSGRIVIPFDVSLNANPPDQLTARLEVSGTQQGNTIYFSTSGWSDGLTRRLALLFDASAFTTGSYGYRIVVTSVYGGTGYDAIVTGRVGVLNETGSAFGRGWRLAGLRKLRAQGDTITIAGCDCADEAHGLTVFFPTGGGGYSGPAGEYSTLAQLGGGGYLRTMPGGTKHYFSSGGLQDSTVDRNGNRTQYTYDGSQRLTGITDPVGWTVASISYGSGTVTFNLRGSRTAVLTLTTGKLTQVTDPDGSSVSFGYDGSNRLSSRTSKRGHATSYTYDYGWLPAGSSLPISANRSFVSPRRAGLANYPTEGTSGSPKVAGAPESATGNYTDARGKVWTLAIDPSLALTLWNDPLGDSTTWIRNAAGAATKRVLPNGRDTRYTYTNYKVTSIEEMANNARWTFSYGSYNNLTRATYPAGDTIWLSYDGNGNPNQLIVAQDSIWQVTYNGRGQPVKIIRRYVTKTLEDTTIHWETADSLWYDEAASKNLRKLKTHRATAAWDTVGISYDAIGRVNQVRDHRGGTVQFGYDSMNRVTGRTDQLSRAESWALNAAGRDSVWTNRRGQTIAYGYDALDRLTQRVTDETTVYQYDAEDNLTAAYDAADTLYFYPDALGRDTATTQNGKLIKYTYYPGMWDRQTLRDPDNGTHTFTFDVLSRLTQIQDPESKNTTFEYDLSNRRTKRTQANSVQTAYTFTGFGLTRIAATYGGTTYSSFDYTYDGQGNRDGWTYENGDVYTFTHDWQGQLTGATLKDSASTVIHSTSFTYDEANNRTAGGNYSGYTYDAANRLAATQSSAYTYDLDGNQTMDSSTAGQYTYTYDREGRQIGQSGPGLTATFNYDPLGRRVKQTVNGTVTKFLYDGDHVLADLNSGGTTIRRYTVGPRVDEIVSVRMGSVTYYYLQDALGSVVRILDGSRNTKNGYSYLAWGEIRTQTETITNRHTYTGREDNPDGRTMHYRARTYTPDLGRLAQEDPLGFLSGVNLYVYVGNSPCTYVDPYGEKWWHTVWGKAAEVAEGLTRGIDAGCAAAGVAAALHFTVDPVGGAFCAGWAVGRVAL